MVITINGESSTIEHGMTVSGLLNSLGVTHQAVAVMVEGAIVSREQFGHVTLQPGQSVEIIRFVGGGY
ncbi:MAG: thiamine biosynthesis protein ThiS [Sulfobacillus thermosulfidooxidans]|uniref:Thiamine biosynthesis protein ThiS n=1 Tax=Sulfobacillus thermotolerans TaxID=338644 RepID=A0ABM6RUQ6_9FIRM|nr:thiamine biosynthesis protein ThiS [Sulfobacillus thermotolerans]POB10153.1 thiamine biosynthesis protein ThiS [Sulfobacillus sp. hq2]PSR37976.1 MAG: thiamine biosynthesis protein ThiS [Sulfobacillus thermosulfidooxidans]